MEKHVGMAIGLVLSVVGWRFDNIAIYIVGSALMTAVCIATIEEIIELYTAKKVQK